MNFDESVRWKLDKIQSNPKIAEANKVYLDKTIRFLNAQGLSPRTKLRWLDCLETFFKELGNKDVDSVNREQMEDAIANINTLEYKEETKAKIRAIIKAFYKHFFGEDIMYPKVVAWMTTSVKNNKKLLPKDLLTEEEVLSLIEAAKTQRDKAIISLLYDSGIRAGELLEMKKKDIDLSTEPAHITVFGKTGNRKIPIMFSAPHIAIYLNEVKTKLKADDYLW